MTSARDIVETIFNRAVDAVTPHTVVAETLRMIDERTIEVEDMTYRIPAGGVYLVGLGKASAGMAEAVLARVGDIVRGGLVVTKHMPSGSVPGVEVISGSHPVPDEKSFEAGRRLAEFVREIPTDSLVICLISGGGSALAEHLRSGVDSSEFAEVTDRLLRAGADIHELNAVRSRFSALKGGGLLNLLGDRAVVNLIISDVLGDDPTVIASGPTVPAATRTRAEDVLERYEIDIELPDTTEEADRPKPHTVILGNLVKALTVAAESAAKNGYQPFILSSRLDGEARAVGRTIATIALDGRDGRSDIGRGVCLLAGGETTVQVRGDGVGGRNTEAALAAGIRLSGTSGITVGFLATDGDDGETGSAGAIVDGATIPGERIAEARRALHDNDSFTFLNQHGAAYSPGPTGTNVNDLVIGLIEA